MLKITDFEDNEVTVTPDLVVSGETNLKNTVKDFIDTLDPELIHANPLAVIYYEMKERGFEVVADPPEDIKPLELPDDAVA